MNIVEEIRALCREKNAIIMAHYYQRPEIQDVADFVGDSLALAQQAAKTDADIIVMCGVHFMAETAKILCPDKKVLIPAPEAGCSLADSCKAADLAAWKTAHPDHMVVSYVNTSAAVKALTEDGNDFVYIHIEAPDEMGHQGSYERKVKAIENSMVL